MAYTSSAGDTLQHASAPAQESPASLASEQKSRQGGQGIQTAHTMACAQVLRQMREKLHLKCAFLQLPVGLEHHHEGLVDLVQLRAYSFGGAYGETLGEVSYQAAENRVLPGRVCMVTC